MSSTEATSGAWFALLERHAQEFGNKAAISVRAADGSFLETSYAELLARVRAFAELFQQKTQPGEIIPLCLARGAEAASAMLGALTVGRAFCCVNQKLKVPQIEHIVRACAAGCVVVDEAGLCSLRGQIDAQSPLFEPEWIILGEPGLSRLARRVYEGFSARHRSACFEPVCKDGTFEPHETPALPGACLFTSGSTGTPKGVLISGSDLRARARAEVAWYGLSASDVLLNVLPFSFDVGLNQLLSAVTAGAELVVLDSWLPQDILATAAARSVTGISGVPSIWSDLVREGKAFERKGAHRSLRYVTVSGGDMTTAQHARFPEVVQGAQIFKTYGQTEAFRASSLRPDEYKTRPTSVGRPFLGVRIYIVRDDGSLALPGEPGEVVHSGLGVMFGYLDGHDPQRKLRDNPWRSDEDTSSKVIFTGDVGHLDHEGFLHLTGRRDDMVKIQGNRVYPREVQNQIASMTGVSTVEVIVARVGDRAELSAFVVADPDVSLDAKELRVRLQRSLPSYMVPEILCVRESLPRTASGKPDRVSLAAQAVEMLTDSQTAR